jgi:uncharacterized small protein (DUF1192 family)
MFDDLDTTPQKQPKKPRDLSGMSVEELNRYIDDLDAEKARAATERDKKQAYKDSLGSLFKK